MQAYIFLVLNSVLFIYCQVLTVNGARIGNHDLPAHHGFVHELDRVLFPPTVGDLLQTLQVLF